MQIPVLVEEVPGSGFRARGGEPFALVADGSTRDEAVAKLRRLIEDRLAGGTQIVPLEVPATVNPWEQMSGMYANDPLCDEWQEAIEEYRDRADQDEAGQSLSSTSLAESTRTCHAKRPNG